jgi:hypothetical protein
MAKVKIDDKGFIRCEVRGFGAEGNAGMKRMGLHLPRAVCVAARGHMIWILEPEFIPDAPVAESPVDVEKLPPLDP